MPSAKQIKNRIRSMESTRQITKAMEMVAASKLHRAQARALASRPYFEILFSTVNEIAASGRALSSPYLEVRPGKKRAYVVIAGDRGLAGGYNSNVLKSVLSELEGKNVRVVPVGRRAVDCFRSRNVPMLTVEYAQAEEVTWRDCFALAGLLCEKYLAGELDEIHVVYTNFVTVLTQTPGTLRLLPLGQTGEKTGSVLLCEPDCATVFDAVIPQYVGGVLYGALCESRASEQAARRTAMDTATQNADEMITRLRLEFNRARQRAITQEITEIVAGS